VQLESIPFFFAKSSSFVEKRIVQKLVTEEIRFNERAVVQVLTSVQHCGYEICHLYCVCDGDATEQRVITTF
jgi:acetolactate synthase regulatory subunit